MEFLGSAIPNNSVVIYSNIDTGGVGRLSCVTDRVDCCSEDNGTKADWFDPNGSEVADTQFRRRKTGLGAPKGYIQLVRKSSATNVQEGIYHCTIPAPNGYISTLYVGIYTDINISE